MGRNRIESSPADLKAQHMAAVAMHHFLREYYEAATRGYESAKVGWGQTEEQKYRGEMAYWSHVQRGIAWLISHVDRWVAKHVTEITDEQDAGTAGS